MSLNELAHMVLNKHAAFGDEWYSGNAQADRGSEKMKQATRALGIGGEERTRLMREGLSDRAQGSDRARAGNNVAMGLLGAGIGGLSAAGSGGGVKGSLLGAAMGAGLYGGGHHLYSKLRAQKDRETAADEGALRARVLGGVATPKRLKQETDSIANLVAAREGRTPDRGGLFNINIGHKNSANEPRRNAGYGESDAEKQSSIDEEIIGAFLEGAVLASGLEGDDATAYAEALLDGLGI